jgi:hypothetical protein
VHLPDPTWLFGSTLNVNRQSTVGLLCCCAVAVVAVVDDFHIYGICIYLFVLLLRWLSLLFCCRFEEVCELRKYGDLKRNTSKQCLAISNDCFDVFLSDRRIGLSVRQIAEK